MHHVVGGFFVGVFVFARVETVVLRAAAIYIDSQFFLILYTTVHFYRFDSIPKPEVSK
jgi:hypothetical protein